MSEGTDDTTRIARLKELATAGLTGGEASYFNHLINIYAKLRNLTPPERKRIDEFLESHRQ